LQNHLAPMRVAVVVAAISQAVALPTTGKVQKMQAEISMLADPQALDSQGCLVAGDCKPWCTKNENIPWTRKCLPAFHCCNACETCGPSSPSPSPPETPPPSPSPSTPPPVYNHEGTAAWLSETSPGRLLASRATSVSPSTCVLGGTWINSGSPRDGTVVASSGVADDGSGYYYCSVVVSSHLKMVKFYITIEDGAAYGRIISAAYASSSYGVSDSESVFSSSTTADTAHSFADGGYGVAELSYSYESAYHVFSTTFIASDDRTVLASSAGEMGPTSCSLGGTMINSGSPEDGEIIAKSSVGTDGTGTYYCAVLSDSYMKMVEFEITTTNGVAYAEATDAGYLSLGSYSLDDVESAFSSSTKVSIAESYSSCCYGIAELDYTNTE